MKHINSRRYRKKKTRQRGGKLKNKTVKQIPKTPKHNVFFIGKIYSNSCIHCVNMKEEWDKLLKYIADRKLNIEVIEIEHDEIETKLSNLNNRVHPEVVKADGYPTIFKFTKFGKIEYFQNLPRTFHEFQYFIHK